jgi:arylsulfatase A-like enzyme
MKFMRTAGFLATLLLALAFTQDALAAERQRSVILIVIDSLRPDHLQTYGSKRATSPNLLRLSQRATVFTNAYAAASWTRPSMLSMLTGEYPSELSANHGGGVPLKDGHRTIATVLRSYGYRTGAVFNTPQLTRPLANLDGGFSTFDDYGDPKETDLPLVERGVTRAIHFLRGSGQPAFLLLHILDPHIPYAPAANRFGKGSPAEFRAPYDWATPVPDCDSNRAGLCHYAKAPAAVARRIDLYDTEIFEVDRQLARLFAFVESDPRYSDALLIVTADHGEEFGEHGGLYHGARFYEETIRVPLIIRDPVRTHSIGRRVPSLVGHVDLVPTILQAVGIAFSTSEYSGKSLVEYLARRGGLPRDTVFVEKAGCSCSGMIVVRHKEWKMFFPLMHPNLELYNLRTDPGEKKNLIASKDPAAQAAARRLTTLYQEWYRRVSRPLASRSDANAIEIPPQLLERLRSLGYLQ